MFPAINIINNIKQYDKKTPTHKKKVNNKSTIF